MAEKASGTRPVVASPRLWNRVIDATNHYEQQQRLGTPVHGRPSPISQTSVKVRNQSGGNLARGSVLRTDGNLLTGLSEYNPESLWFTGSTPNSNQKFGILRRPTRADEIDDLQVAGVCIARVFVVDESHTHAVTVAGETYLRSSIAGPFVILDKPTGEGEEVEAVVVFRDSGTELLRFQLTENLVLGGQADAVIVRWNGAAYAATESPIIVKDFTATPGSWQGAAGFRGWCTLPPDNDDGKYEIVWMEDFGKVSFTLTSNMTSGEATATVDHWFDIKQPTSSPIIVSDTQNVFRRAMSGAKGTAIYNPKTDKYVVVECETKAGWIRGTLTADGFTSGESAGANVSAYGGSQQDVQNPGSTVVVYDPQLLFRRARSGAKYYATYDCLTDRYVALECQSKAGEIEFTLTSSLGSGSATATIDRWAGTQQDTQEPDSPVTVYDDQGIFPRARSGAKGVAVYDAEADKYRVTTCQQMTKRISGTIPSSLVCGLLTSLTNFDIPISALENMDFSPFNQMPEGFLTGEPEVATLTIYNPFSWTAAVGAYFHAAWHETKNRWELSQIDARCDDPEDCP